MVGLSPVWCRWRLECWFYCRGVILVFEVGVVFGGGEELEEVKIVFGFWLLLGV